MELFVLPGLYINISEQKEIIQNVLERKDSMAVLSMGFRKSMCYVLPPPPPLILDKVRLYMQIISHDTLQ
jgi:hypothetical protein